MDFINALILQKILGGSGGGGDITVESLSVIENGTYTAPEGIAYNPVEVHVDVPEPFLTTLTADENGQYTAGDYGVTGWNDVYVSVPAQMTTRTFSPVELDSGYCMYEGGDPDGESLYDVLYGLLSNGKTVFAYTFFNHDDSDTVIPMDGVCEVAISSKTGFPFLYYAYYADGVGGVIEYGVDSDSHAPAEYAPGDSLSITIYYVE